MVTGVKPKQYVDRLEVRLPGWLTTWARVAADLERRTVSNLVRLALEEYLERHYAEHRPTNAADETERDAPLRRSPAQTHSCAVQTG